MIAGMVAGVVLFLAIGGGLRFLDVRARGPRVPFRVAERPRAEVDNSDMTHALAERAARKRGQR